MSLTYYIYPFTNDSVALKFANEGLISSVDWKQTNDKDVADALLVITTDDDFMESSYSLTSADRTKPVHWYIYLAAGQTFTSRNMTGGDYVGEWSLNAYHTFNDATAEKVLADFTTRLSASHHAKKSMLLLARQLAKKQTFLSETGQQDTDDYINHQAKPSIVARKADVIHFTFDGEQRVITDKLTIVLQRHGLKQGTPSTPHSSSLRIKLTPFHKGMVSTPGYITIFYQDIPFVAAQRKVALGVIPTASVIASVEQIKAERETDPMVETTRLALQILLQFGYVDTTLPLEKEATDKQIQLLTQELHTYSISRKTETK